MHPVMRSVAWVHENLSNLSISPGCDPRIPPLGIPAPLNGRRLEVRGISFCYYGMFLIGLAGNISVLTLLLQTYARTRLNRGLAIQCGNIFVYIIALALVDTCVVLSIPLAISDMYLGTWTWGTLVCKAHYTMESFGKVLSTFLLAAMSFDRYMSTCRPKSRFRIKSQKAMFGVCGILVLTAGVILSPITYYAEMQKLDIRLCGPFRQILKYSRVKCRMTQMPGALLENLVWLMFGVGFILPSIVIGASHGGVLRKVYTHHTSMKRARSRVPTKRVFLFTMAVSIFYYACWTPYWIAFLTIKLKKVGGIEGRGFVYFMYMIHALPFLSSSFNWIFYALLNNQLRRIRRRLSEMDIEHTSFFHSSTRRDRNGTMNGNQSLVVVGTASGNHSPVSVHHID